MPKAGKGDGVRRPVRSAAGGVPAAPSAPITRLLALVAALPLLAACQPDVVQLSGPTMGSSYHISYVRASGTPEPEAVQAEIRRQLDQLDAAVSTYRNDSDLARFNAAPAGTCQPMPPMALELARSAKQLAADSEGAYDVTLLPVLDAWKFGPKAAREKAQGKTPEPNAPAAGNDKSLTVDQLMAQSGAPKQPSQPPARPALDADDVADLVEYLPPAVVEKIQRELTPEEREQLRAAMSYPEDSVGGRMDFEFVRVREDVTLEVVLRYLRRFDELPQHTDQVFVVDRNGMLTGSLSKRRR